MEMGIQSLTLKSYFSTVKCMLIDDGYPLNQEKVLLGTLTKACRQINDTVRIRLPIHKSLLELLLFEIERAYVQEPYLECMFKAFFLLSYYGLFHIGELALGDHRVKAKRCTYC